MWRLFRFYKVAAQNKVKTSAEDKLEGSRSVPQVNEHKTVVENIKETQEAEDLKRDLLHLLEIIADFHERIKKVPALLGDAPTDAEYATELIRERILKGQDVTLRNKKRNHNAKGGDIGLAMNTSSHDRPNERDGVNWRKWGARAAKYKSVLEDGKSISSIGHALWNKVSPDDEWATSGSGIEQTHIQLQLFSVLPLRRPSFLHSGTPRCVVLYVASKYVMFFSTDLLSRRDSGFGLLWLAATLGPKSTFKKLPKTSVMSADITQLCELIATPVEPLALRLSSNLLVGAARVYKVKQEIFMSDVTICFNSLKRVVQDLRSVTTSEALLQMSQPSVRPSAVTLRIDPDAAFAMDLDNRVDWDEYLNFSVAPEVSCTSSDDDYDPKASKSKRKAKTSVIPPSSMEAVRAKAHTLDENLEFLLANSLDTSFGGSGVAMPTSSQLGGFGSDDAFFGAFDGLDIEGIGDDLVRELGEDWGANPTEHSAKEDVAPIGELAVPGYDVADMDLSMQRINDVNETLEAALQAVPVAPPHQNFSGQLVEMSPVSMCSSKQPQESSSPGKPEAIDEDVAKNRDRAAPKKNIKHARVVLDVRIELTDDELKAARIHYLGQQRLIRQESQRKQFEKERQVLINNLLCGIPDNGTLYETNARRPLTMNAVQAKELIDFWISNYKTRVEARTDSFEGVLYGRALTKCGKGSNMLTILTNMDDVPQTSPGLTVSADLPVTRPSEENGMDFGFDYDVEVNLDADEHQRGASRLRSSEVLNITCSESIDT
ncbi:hypothetical protein ID866_2415 [Astraeus odoratus]|nr:hypothetical protein ID866_2415 [Astraeus odoratus]